MDARAGEACLALPKLNLQFLTFHDYLLRNFNLFRLEATYEVGLQTSSPALCVSAWQLLPGARHALLVRALHEHCEIQPSALYSDLDLPDLGSVVSSQTT